MYDVEIKLITGELLTNFEPVNDGIAFEYMAFSTTESFQIEGPKGTFYRIPKTQIRYNRIMFLGSDEVAEPLQVITSTPIDDEYILK